MKNIPAIICFVLLFVQKGNSQSVKNFKTIGSPINKLCPNFVFDTLINYKNEKLALADLRGKFIIIDFWGTFCLPCIADIPKLEKLQKRFGDTLQILMAVTDGIQSAQLFYENRKKGNKPITLPCTADQEACDYFQVKSVSTYVWIDDQGYVKGITDYSQVTEQNIADFVNKKNIHLRGLETKTRADDKRYLVTIANEIDSSNVLYNSSLTKYLNGVKGVYKYPRKGVGTKVYATNTSVSYLYRIAFGDSSGAVPYSRTLIESAHPERYALSNNEDFEKWKWDNTFCYELTVPVARQNDILRIMLDDLNRHFGGRVNFENRTQKCLVLTAEKNLPVLTTKSSIPKKVMNAGGVTVINYPLADFIEIIEHYLPKEIILDETGISGNVEIIVQAEMNNVESLNAALKKYGLRLQYEDRLVKMLVIKDPQ
ncbi:TlpA family protein disulfide reductase [Niastella caeni]|uniref:TlpA family protein disulfide reductase n=1 Tax=Niastella caeni TaxID=2569763 RepID=A0A4S8HY98_9BACT|nr:redoxin domain-containing protein [Niastella caeni]THU40291.1 TlpA family protein disulfide reductase [Niastella caeni]